MVQGPLGLPQGPKGVAPCPEGKFPFAVGADGFAGAPGFHVVPPLDAAAGIRDGAVVNITAPLVGGVAGA